MREGHARAFKHPHQVADLPVYLDDERMHLIQTQLVAHMASTAALQPLSVPPTDSLSETIKQAEKYQIITPKQASILRDINIAGNRAKHELPK